MKIYMRGHEYDFYYYAAVTHTCDIVILSGYSYIEVKNISYEDSITLWEGFTERFNIPAYEVLKISDEAIVIITNTLTFINYYNSTEGMSIEKFISSIQDIPAMVVHEEPFSYFLNMHVLPTIYIPTQDEKSLEKDVEFSFRGLENLFYIPKYLSSSRAEALRGLNCLEQAIVTPLFYVLKNEGIGNTVILRGHLSLEESLGYKTIYEALQEELFWKRVLLPLATEDFDRLKEELYNTVLSTSLSIKKFSLSMHKYIIDEVKSLEASKASLEADIAVKENDIRYNKTLIEITKRNIQERKQSLNACISTTKLKEEIEAIRALPYISAITLADNSIVIETHPIQIDDGPILGGYEITYNVLNNYLSITNLINPMNGCHHPHIHGDIFCWGNYSDVPVYFATGDFLVGTEMLHKFLSTYNVDDEWGDTLIFWDAEYAFKNIIDVGRLRDIDAEFDDYYYNIYGEHLPNCRRCPDCDELEENCTCHICEYCGESEDYCTCWICPECGGKVDYSCECNRCPKCNELLEDCECERCKICGGLIDRWDEYPDDCCSCERCLEDYDKRIDEDTCSECEDWECENNTNEGHATTQDEVLF